jgi:drug/metabolite transporter (DMT)-like permease
VASPGFIYLLWRAGGLPGLTRGEALRILVASAGGVTAYHLALNEGERTTASGVAALIVALGPAATLALSLAVGLERFAPRRIAGIALAFAGVVVVVGLGSGAHFSLHGLRGPLLVLVAPLTFAVYNVLYKPLLGRYDLPALTAAGGLVGSLLFLPFENTGAIDRFGALGAGSWIVLAALGLGATMGGYVTWSMALRGLEPSRAMAYLYCVPPLAVAIGAIFLDEPVTLWLLLGGALVIGGVAVAQRGPARKAGIPPGACIEGADGQPCRT